MESLLKNLEKHVTCSICLDTYTKPKTIACLHTFCLKCLEEHALRTQRQGQFRCPDCQAEVNIPEGNCFDNLPTGFLQNSLLSLLAVRMDKVAMEVRSVVVSVRKRAPRSAIASLAKNYCAVTVLMHTNCFKRGPFEDTE